MKYHTCLNKYLQYLLFAFLYAAVLVGLLVNAGCSGGGDGQTVISDLNIVYSGKTESAELDAATVSTMLSEMGLYVPGCVVSEDAPAPSAHPVLPLAAAARMTSPLAAAPIQVAAVNVSFEVAGTCGGRAFFIGVHEDGDTTGTLTFENYCYEDGVSGETTVNGDVDLVQDGTPSPTGPIVDEVRALSAELNLVSTVGGEMSIAFKGFTYHYGNPEPWTPGLPTEENPDVLDVELFLLRNDLTGAVSKLESFQVSGYKDDLGQDIVSGGGRIYFPDYGYVDLETVDGSPLVVDRIALATGQPSIVGGKLVLTGSDGVTLTLTVGDLVSVFVAVMEDPLFPTMLFDCTTYDASGLVEAIAALKALL